uniref:Predicted protein n=1 Tax=Physcomitrium patens TaxID=3218 RepID=A9U4C7_PHYPA
MLKNRWYKRRDRRSMSGDYDYDNHRRNQQVKERQERFYFRNLLRQQQEGIQRKKRRWSWIKPWLHACASIRAYPSSERSAILHHYIPLEKLPRALVGDTASNEASESSSVIIRSLSTEELNNSDSLQERRVSKYQIGTKRRIHINIARRPAQAPMTEEAPAVPIAVQMGAIGDRTTNVAPLSTFNGWPELKMFVKESQPVTVAASSARAKVREECYYDQLLMVGTTMIPSVGNQVPMTSTMIGSYPRMIAPSMRNPNSQGVVNATLLRAIPPVATYPSPMAYRQLEVPMNATINDSNEALLLNLMKKMEELAVHMTKDKEKRHKPSNMRPNVWCNNCKGQGYFDTECPSPHQKMGQCMYCGGKHNTANCWYLPRQQIMIQPTVWDVNQGPAHDINSTNYRRNKQTTGITGTSGGSDSRSIDKKSAKRQRTNSNIGEIDTSPGQQTNTKICSIIG